MSSRIKKSILKLKESSTLVINEKSKELINQGKKVYQFGFGQSPFPVPEKIVDALKNNAHRKEYLPIQGLPQLREVISNDLKITDINKIYINTGPGSFAGIRNSLSIVKAFNIAKKIDYYCYSLDNFKGEFDVRYENIPDLCDKFKIKKNLINPVYIS